MSYVPDDGDNVILEFNVSYTPPSGSNIILEFEEISGILPFLFFMAPVQGG